MATRGPGRGQLRAGKQFWDVGEGRGGPQNSNLPVGAPCLWPPCPPGTCPFETLVHNG